MKILVTGGFGYIGAVMIQKLAEHGIKSIVYDKGLFCNDFITEQVGSIPSKVIYKEINDISVDDLNDVDAVFHLAAISNDPCAELSVEDTMRVNVNGTIAVANACIKAGIPLYYASTASVYGQKEWACVTEDEPQLNPQSTYGRSKVKAEEALLELSYNNPGFNPIIFRQSTVYGYSPRMRYDLVVNTFFKDAMLYKQIHVFGGGEVFRPLVSVDDIANAYITAIQIQKDLKRPEIINLVHENYYILSLAFLMQDLLYTNHNIKAEVIIDRTQSKDSRNYAISDVKACNLGIYCPISIEYALDNMMYHWQQGHCADFDNPIYYNHRYTKLLQQIQQYIKNIPAWETIP